MSYKPFLLSAGHATNVFVETETQNYPDLVNTKVQLLNSHEHYLTGGPG